MLVTETQNQVNELLSSSSFMHWDFNEHVERAFDRDLKEYIYACNSNGVLLFPGNLKEKMCFTQHFMLLQVFVPTDQTFSMELKVSDNQSLKSVFISSSIKEQKVTGEKACIPIAVKGGMWNTLIIDLSKLVRLCR